MTVHGPNVRRILYGAAALALVLFPATVAAADTSGLLVVTSDTTLTEDHDGSIVIGADNVTLDCAGFRVIGTHESDGIVIEGHNSVAVRNCVVQQFVYGIVVRSSSGILLEHNEVRSNGLSGMDVCCGSVNVVVRQNTMHENGFDAGFSGIDVEYGSTNIDVSGNTSWGNAGSGFYTFQSSNLVFDNNVAFSNSQGFNLDAETTNSHFSNNVVRGNAGNGFGSVVGGSSDNVFVGNTSKDNGGAGFFFEGAQGNVLRKNTAVANGIFSGSGGFFLGSSSNNLVQQNLSVGNGFIGFFLLGGNGNVLDSNEARANLDVGIALHGSVNTTLSMNRSVGNLRRGFIFIEETGLLLLGNDAVGNEGHFGYEVHQGSAMTWRGNSAIGNGAGFLLDTVNHSVFTRNAARDSTLTDADGFSIGSSSGNEFRGNSSVRNGQTGFRIFEGSNDNIFEMNQANANGIDGFSIQSSNGNLLEMNQAMLNGARGFSVLFGSSANTLRRNLACRNSELDAFDDHTGTGNVWEANVFCTSNI